MPLRWRSHEYRAGQPYWSTSYLDVASALTIGALISFEREKHKANKHLQGALGLRSFIIAALAGAVGALMARAIEQKPMAAGGGSAGCSQAWWWFPM